MADDDPKSLCLRAYLALQGASLDWRGDLAELMRSDVPLSRMLRERLAAAFENESPEGPRLDLKNHKVASDRLKVNVARHDWMEIGRWTDAKREQGLSRKLALEKAAEHFVVGEKKCDEALIYYGRVKQWVDAALETQSGQALGRDWLERLYHSFISHPDMKRVNAELIRQLGLSH
jgi:hypothetical protein